MSKLFMLNFLSVFRKKSIYIFSLVHLGFIVIAFFVLNVKLQSSNLDYVKPMYLTFQLVGLTGIGSVLGVVVFSLKNSSGLTGIAINYGITRKKLFFTKMTSFVLASFFFSVIFAFIGSLCLLGTRIDFASSLTSLLIGNFTYLIFIGTFSGLLAVLIKPIFILVIPMILAIVSFIGISTFAPKVEKLSTNLTPNVVLKDESLGKVRIFSHETSSQTTNKIINVGYHWVKIYSSFMPKSLESDNFDFVGSDKDEISKLKTFTIKDSKYLIFKNLASEEAKSTFESANIIYANIAKDQSLIERIEKVNMTNKYFLSIDFFDEFWHTSVFKDITKDNTYNYNTQYINLLKKYPTKFEKIDLNKFLALRLLTSGLMKLDNYEYNQDHFSSPMQIAKLSDYSIVATNASITVKKSDGIYFVPYLVLILVFAIAYVLVLQKKNIS